MVGTRDHRSWRTWMVAAAASLLVATPAVAGTEATEPAAPDTTAPPAPTTVAPETTVAPPPETTIAVPTTSEVPTDTGVPPESSQPTDTAVESTVPTDVSSTTTTTVAATTTTSTTIVTPSTEELISTAKPLVDTGEVRVITFPMVGSVRYGNDWGACRDLCTRYHKGNDLIGQARLQPVVAMVDGTVHHLISHPTAGYGVAIVDAAGWRYDVYHLNNDSPGTDDGADGGQWRFAAGVVPGAAVRAGELIGWMGDSGNSEHSVPHAHVEIHRPDGSPINPYWSLARAERAAVCVGNSRLGVAPSPSVDTAIPASALSAWTFVTGGTRIWLDGVEVFLSLDGYAAFGAPLVVGRGVSPASADCKSLGDAWQRQAGAAVNGPEPLPPAEPADGDA